MKIVNGVSCFERDEWLDIGTKLYGESARDWKFECPNCGNIQSGQDFIALKEAKIISADFEIEKYVYFSCIGRYDTRIKHVGTLGDGIKPCDYTNGGLFNISKVKVKIGDKSVSVFGFADDYSALVTLEA